MDRHFGTGGGSGGCDGGGCDGGGCGGGGCDGGDPDEEMAAAMAVAAAAESDERADMQMAYALAQVRAAADPMNGHLSF